MILQKVEEDKCLELDIQDEKVHQEQGGALELKDLGTEKSGIESEKVFLTLNIVCLLPLTIPGDQQVYTQQTHKKGAESKIQRLKKTPR